MVAPSIGGILQELFNWQAIFWCMAGLGALCLIVTWRYIPETNLRPVDRLSFGSLFRNFALLLRDRDFLLFSACASLSSGVFFAFLGGAPYVSERLLELSPSTYGLWFACVAIGYALGNFLAGRFTEHFGIARMILAGSALAVIATLLPPLLFALGLAGPAALFLPMTLTGLANGLSLPSAISGAVSVRPEIAGAASGLSGAAQIGMGAVLSALAGAVLAGSRSAMPMFALMAAAGLLALIVGLAIYGRHRR
jgi:DHA1 family bicyclomycin/chloramphenicol resistance-like MFS transporter